MLWGALLGARLFVFRWIPVDGRTAAVVAAQLAFRSDPAATVFDGRDPAPLDAVPGLPNGQTEFGTDAPQTTQSVIRNFATHGQ